MKKFIVLIFPFLFFVVIFLTLISVVTSLSLPIAEEDKDVETEVPVTSTTTAPASAPFDAEIELKLSPKLLNFLGRLLAIEPSLIKEGEARLGKKAGLGSNQIEQVLKEATSAERHQFYEDEKEIEKLYQESPEAKKLVDSLLSNVDLEMDDKVDDDDDDEDKDTSSGDELKKGRAYFEPTKTLQTDGSDGGDGGVQGENGAEFAEIYSFFKDFTHIDKKLDSNEAWNRYWDLWFRKYSDYMAKYG